MDITLNKNKNALVLFSGGQDSTTCLLWSLQRFNHVETLSINYGQSNSIELKVRKKIISNLKKYFPKLLVKLKKQHLVALPQFGKLNQTSLTGKKIFKTNDNNLPNSFVPGRNIFFFTLAASIAYNRGIKNIIAGVCETDYSGYPDCRNNTINALQVALNLGMEDNFNLITPLMWRDKSQIWCLANNLGGKEFVNIIINFTHTCYRGDRTKLHSWGYGCGTCPACKLRSKGWYNYKKLNL